MNLTLQVPDALVEEIAQRAAEIVLAQLDTASGGDWPEYMTPAQAARYIGADRQRIYDLRSAGRLTRYGDGSRALIRRRELDAYVAGGRVAQVLPMEAAVKRTAGSRR